MSDRRTDREKFPAGDLCTVREEAAAEEPGATSCVICLENVSERAVASPCSHDNFDFICLITWLQERSSCPLCKAPITSVRYQDQDGKPKVYRIEINRDETVPQVQIHVTPCSPPVTTRSPPWVQHLRAGQRHTPRQFTRRRRQSPPPSDDAVLLRRKRIYELGLYSLHVGSNRLSGYSDLTPARFISDPHLVSRARKWIRRELQVFDFLSSPTRRTSSQSSLSPKSSIPAQRASSNAEFLLEYIVSILKTVDIKGSKGQAQEMLGEFLGEKSSLFLHELNAWLRSPFEELSVWDRNVRYPWPDGEERKLKRTIRDALAGGEELQWDSDRKRRIDRWIPD